MSKRGHLAPNEIYCVACKHAYKVPAYDLSRDRNGRARMSATCPMGHKCYKYVSEDFYQSHRQLEHYRSPRRARRHY